MNYQLDQLRQELAARLTKRAALSHDTVTVTLTEIIDALDAVLRPRLGNPKTDLSKLRSQHDE
jgi:hypothetical protein